LALGVSGVTLQELVQAYDVLANQGKKVTPYFIKKIVTAPVIFSKKQKFNRTGY